MANGLLTEEEVRSYLNVTPIELEQLIRRGKLTAFRVGGQFLRYRKEEVVKLRTGQKSQMSDQLDRTWNDKVRDFLGFYGFYFLLITGIILVVLFFVRF